MAERPVILDRTSREVTALLFELEHSPDRAERAMFRMYLENVDPTTETIYNDGKSDGVMAFCARLKDNRGPTLWLCLKHGPRDDQRDVKTSLVVEHNLAFVFSKPGVRNFEVTVHGGIADTSPQHSRHVFISQPSSIYVVGDWPKAASAVINQLAYDLYVQLSPAKPPQT